MKIICMLVFMGILMGCNQNKSKYVLDDKSEMANLMLEMHTELNTLQEKIKLGVGLGAYPEKFDGVMDATMTDESMRTDNWQSLAEALIQSQKTLYTATPAMQEQAYKEVVNNCMACHTTVGCRGPIPKIQKLYWKPN